MFGFTTIISKNLKSQFNIIIKTIKHNKEKVVCVLYYSLNSITLILIK